MKYSFFKNKKALGLIEIVIAVVIVVGAGIPILKMVSTSRTETSSSVNYLRALELADEALEWASITNFNDLETKMSSLCGTIVNDNGGGEPINAKPVEYDNWKGSDIFESDLKYSDQYSTAFFYRIIDVEPITSSSIEDKMLKKVTVTIKWCEGHRPSNINTDSSDRNRQVQLSILVINDENLVY